MKRDRTFLVVAGLLAFALAVGGAGMNFPALEMILDLVALGVAATLVWRGRVTVLSPLSRWALVLIAAVLALPLLQLIPLPPGIWQALPGRVVPAQVDAALGLRIWRPLTLDFEGTLRAVLSLVPACVLFFGCLKLKTSERATLLQLIAAFALLNALLGIMQLASGGLLTPFPSAHLGYPIGLFVNRNHNAVFLLLSMPIVAALGAQRAQKPSTRLAFIVGTLALVTIFGIVIIGTTSRMALVLLPIALAGSLLVLFFRQSLWRVAIPSTLGLGVIAAVISWVGGFNRNLSRFSNFNDARFDYWDDVSWALHHYGLAGTGFGTFVPVYQTAESLGGVGPSILNHAHNDFIEVVLEGGIPAILLLILFFVILGFAAARLMKLRFDLNRALTSFAAAIGIVMVLLFSLVDYPLRMPAIACAFAVLCACLLPTPRAIFEPEQAPDKLKSVRVGGMGRIGKFPAFVPRVLVSMALATIAFFVIQAGVSASALLGDDFAFARSWAPWSTAALAGVADDELTRSKPREAMLAARSALKLSPINSEALRTAAMTQSVGGSTAAGERLMEIAVSLGWRDPLTQLWAMEASQQTKDPQKALERAEALFQQDMYLPTALAVLVEDAPGGPTSTALVRRMVQRPLWRSNVLKSLAILPSGYFTKAQAMVLTLDQTRAPLSNEEAQPLINRLLSMRDFENARRIWMGTRASGLVANGGFENLGSRNGADVPADWDISDEDLATIAIQHPDFTSNGRALRISGSARSGPILSQRLILSPGAYLLSYRARSGAGAPVGVRWLLNCETSDGNETGPTDSPPSTSWQEFHANFTVPIRDCPIQTLALQRPDDIHSQEVWVDDVILTPTTH